MKRSASRRPVFALTPDALAKQAGDSLRQGRFKEATEMFKQLIRQDPRPEWTERLADAYAGRARDLAAKGMYKEAAIVLGNTLAPDRTIREPLLYVSCLVRQGQHQQAQRTALNNLARLPAAESARLAECAAVLSLAALAPEAAPSTRDAWAEQSNAARAALLAWLQGSPPEELDRLLGRISLRSAFGPMRLILKSLITPPGNADKARALLAMIPSGSVFAGPRAATEAALANGDDLLDRWTRLRPAQQHFVAETRGLPQGAMALLNQMLDAERRGPSSLFNVLMRRDLPFPEADLRAACLNLLPVAPDRLHEFQSRYGLLSALERSRILALATEAKGDWEAVPHSWRSVIEVLEKDSVPDARLGQAVIFRHLVSLAHTHPDAWDDPRVPAGEDPEAHYLERSIKADPDFLPATLRLLERYRTVDDQENWQRAADAAAERFPTNVAVLTQAVDAAVARNAFKRAVVYARQVLQVDPINQPVRQRMIELQLAYARRQMRSSRADLAGKALAEAAEWERPDQPSGALRIGMALVRLAAEPDADAAAMLRDAVQQAGGGAAAWLHLTLEASLMGVPDKRLHPVRADLAEAQESEPDRETILSLVSLLGQKEIRDTRKKIAPLLQQISRFLIKGSRIAWTAAEFQTVAELLTHLREFAVLHSYAHNALRRSPDQVAQFYEIVARTGGNNKRLNPIDEVQLYDMLEQATARQDFSLFNRVQRFLFGSEASRAMAKMARAGTILDALDESDMAELLESVVKQMPDLPTKEVRSLVNEVGRTAAVAMFAEQMSDSPIGDVLSEEQLMQLSTAMVTSALEGRAQRRQARRR